ncbi:hypothetical protein E1293_21630 [Actinomadura darangshiensis]|uniref:Small hydrophilic protein n=1 Tax=Actinomadura darangshiensis TaxID=705336 RepID=A0A4R5B6Q5_9ACTN|nr:hypothetical protein [Actinomadura darangshiensis]TDD80096.1 hypothetical protein E1293_21630 [Actinomadura darangshiensis]
MATRAAIAGIGAAALATLGLAAGFARAQTSAPPDLGGVVQVSPPPATRPAAPSPTASRTPGREGRAVTPPRPPGSEDDGEVDDDGDDD